MVMELPLSPASVARPQVMLTYTHRQNSGSYIHPQTILTKVYVQQPAQQQLLSSHTIRQSLSPEATSLQYTYDESKDPVQVVQEPLSRKSHCRPPSTGVDQNGTQQTNKRKFARAGRCVHMIKRNVCIHLPTKATSIHSHFAPFCNAFHRIAIHPTPLHPCIPLHSFHSTPSFVDNSIHHDMAFREVTWVMLKSPRPFSTWRGMNWRRVLSYPKLPPAPSPQVNSSPSCVIAAVHPSAYQSIRRVVEADDKNSNNEDDANNDNDDELVTQLHAFASLTCVGRK